MALGDAPLSGEQIPVTLFFNGQPVGTEIVMSLRIAEKTTDHDDSYLGQDRDIPDKQINGYSATLTFNVPDGIIMRKLDELDDARRANRPVPPCSLQYTFINRSGGQDTSYMLFNCVPKSDLDVGGRKDRARLTVRIDAQDRKRILG